jgi:hypothetical protein
LSEIEVAVGFSELHEVSEDRGIHQVAVEVVGAGFGWCRHPCNFGACLVEIDLSGAFAGAIGELNSPIPELATE